MVKSRKLFAASQKDIYNTLLSGSVKIETEDGNPQRVLDNSDEAQIDLRFVDMALSDFKRYPLRRAEEDTGFGLSFSINANSETPEPVHSIFLGSNGIGKTSLYAALEFISMEKMNSAEVRGFTRKIGQNVDRTDKPIPSQIDFIKHVDSSLSDVKIYLRTLDKMLTIDGVNEAASSTPPYVCDAFFCSEYDVRLLESTIDGNYSDFLLKQLGLHNLDICLKTLYHTYSEFLREKESYDIYKLANEEARNELDIIINRCLFGVAVGALNLPDRYFENYILLQPKYDELLNAVEPNVAIEPYITDINFLLNTLLHERVYFPKNNWFTRGINFYLTIAREQLGTIRKSILNRKTNGLDYFYDAYFKLKEYIAFREELYGRIKQTISEKNHLRGEDRLQFLSDRESNLVSSISSGNSIKKRDSSFNSLLRNNEQCDEFKRELQALIGFIEHSMQDLLDNWRDKISTAIKRLLEDYFVMDNDKINPNLYFSSFNSSHVGDQAKQFVNFSLLIESAGGNLETDNRSPMPPNAYLNTFKFKLFCVSLKLAMCCVAKAIYNINFPLVIDDVFDSSDFDNRVKIKEFVSNLLRQHDNLMKDIRTEMPLQIIFFTQDDLIANQMAEGLAESGEKVKFSRIFDYHEIDITNDKLFKISDNMTHQVRLPFKYYQIEDKIV